jgi:DNA-directed RNA polymerase specialized sigma24 family protein
VTHDSAVTCWTVVRAAAAGDAGARAAFAAAYGSTVRGFLRARWRGTRLAQDAEDAVQEVFAECLKPGGVLEIADARRGDFRGLLFGVSRNVARRFEGGALARGRLDGEGASRLAEVAADEPGQETSFDRAWARALVDEAVRRQRERAAGEGAAGARRIEVLERRFQAGEPIRRIAEAWGCPADGVHHLYRLARREFRRCLHEVVAEHVRPGAEVSAECDRLLAALR